MESTIGDIGHVYRFPEPKDTKVVKFGRVTIKEDMVTVSDWSVKDMTLPELRLFAIEWAHARLDEGLDMVEDFDIQ